MRRGEDLNSTLLGRLGWCRARSEKGQRYAFGQPHLDGSVAPKAVIAATAIEPTGSTESRRHSICPFCRKADPRLYGFDVRCFSRRSISAGTDNEVVTMRRVEATRKDRSLYAALLSVPPTRRLHSQASPLGRRGHGRPVPHSSQAAAPPLNYGLIHIKAPRSIIPNADPAPPIERGRHRCEPKDKTAS